MLKLENFKVMNFKNFKLLNLQDIANLTVLIGSNGVGKSNFLSIIDLLSTAYNKDVNAYLEDKKITFRDCTHQWNIGNKIFIQLLFLNKTNNERITYEFSLVYEKDCSDFRVVDEVLFNNSNNKRIVYDNLSDITNNKGLSLKHSKLAHVEEQEVSSFINNIRNYSVYNHINLFNDYISVVDIDSPYLLLQNGNNITSLIYLLKMNYSSSYTKVIGILRCVIKSFEDFHFIKENNQLILKIKMLTSDTPISINQLSDGTIRFIVLNTLFNMPIQLRPSLVLLEEPEAFLHPLAVNLLSDLIDSYTQDSQLIVSTHSPYLLNKLNVEDIYVFDSDESNTTIVKTVESNKMKEWLKSYSLGDLWLMNIFDGGAL